MAQPPGKRRANGRRRGRSREPGARRHRWSGPVRWERRWGAVGWERTACGWQEERCRRPWRGGASVVSRRRRKAGPGRARCRRPARTVRTAQSAAAVVATTCAGQGRDVGQDVGSETQTWDTLPGSRASPQGTKPVNGPNRPGAYGQPSFPASRPRCGHSRGSGGGMSLTRSSRCRARCRPY